jgi:hypothetical protein
LPRDEKASPFQAAEASSLQVAAAGPRPRAMHKIAPHLQNLAQQNDALQRQLSKKQRHSLDQQVEQLVPEFRKLTVILLCTAGCWESMF